MDERNLQLPAAIPSVLCRQQRQFIQRHRPGGTVGRDEGEAADVANFDMAEDAAVGVLGVAAGEDDGVLRRRKFMAADCHSTS